MADISGSGGSGGGSASDGGGGGSASDGGGSASDGGGGGGSKEPTLSNLEKLMNKYLSMYANYSFFGIPSPTNSNLRRFIKKFIGHIARGNYMGALVTFNTMFYGEQADSLLITDNMGEFLLMWPLINAGMTYIQSRLPSESDSEEGSIFSMVATGALGTFETIDSTYGEMAQEYSNTLSAVSNVVYLTTTKEDNVNMVIPDVWAYLSYMKILAPDDSNIAVAIGRLRNIEFILETIGGDFTNLSIGDMQTIITNFRRAAIAIKNAAELSPIAAQGLRLFLQALLAKLSKLSKANPEKFNPQYINLLRKLFFEIRTIAGSALNINEWNTPSTLTQVANFFTYLQYFIRSALGQ